MKKIIFRETQENSRKLLMKMTETNKIFTKFFIKNDRDKKEVSRKLTKNSREIHEKFTRDSQEIHESF